MGTATTVFFVAMFAIVMCAVVWSMFSGKVVGRVEATKVGLFGSRGSSRLVGGVEIAPGGGRTRMPPR